jgi:hypothetical protein
LFISQKFDRLADGRSESGSAGVQMREDRRARRSSSPRCQTATRIMTSNSVLAMHLHPSRSSSSTNLSLAAPIFVRECRRWLPVASRSVLQAMKEEKESGTPKDADP